MQVVFLNYNKHYFNNCVVNLGSNEICVSGRYGCLVKKIKPVFFLTNSIFFLYKQYFRLFLTLLRDMLVGVSFR